MFASPSPRSGAAVYSSFSDSDSVEMSRYYRCLSPPARLLEHLSFLHRELAETKHEIRETTTTTGNQTDSEIGRSPAPFWH